MRFWLVVLLVLYVCFPVQAQYCNHRSFNYGGHFNYYGHGQQRYSAHGHAYNYHNNFAVHQQGGYVYYPPDNSLEQEIGRQELLKFVTQGQVDVLQLQAQVKELRALIQNKGPDPVPVDPPVKPQPQVDPLPLPPAQQPGTFMKVPTNQLPPELQKGLKMMPYADGKVPQSKAMMYCGACHNKGNESKGKGYIFLADNKAVALGDEDLKELSKRLLEDQDMPPEKVHSNISRTDRAEVYCEFLTAALAAKQQTNQ